MSITPTRFMLPPLTPLSQRPVMKPPATGDFGAVLRNALAEVNQAQLDSARLDRMLAQGELAHVHEAVIAAEKATLSLELTIQIRNKILDAYQEIMRMTT